MLYCQKVVIIVCPSDLSEWFSFELLLRVPCPLRPTERAPCGSKNINLRESEFQGLTNSWIIKRTPCGGENIKLGRINFKARQFSAGCRVHCVQFQTWGSLGASSHKVPPMVGTAPSTPTVPHCMCMHAWYIHAYAEQGLLRTRISSDMMNCVIWIWCVEFLPFRDWRKGLWGELG